MADDELQRIVAASGAPRPPQSEQSLRDGSATLVVLGWDGAVLEWMWRQLGTAELDPFGPTVASSSRSNSFLLIDTTGTAPARRPTQ